MKLKVVCQKCGKMEEINTKDSLPWEFKNINDLVSNLPEWMDWEVWFCYDCWSDLNIDEDTEQKIMELFEITDNYFE